MEIDPAFGSWLAGFVDGEGCFFTDFRNGRRPVCGFKIALRLDDLSILEEIKTRLGFGRVSLTPASGGSKPQAEFRISNKDDCRQLVAFFDQYSLRAKKRRDFAIWRRAVQVWASSRGSKSKAHPGLLEFQALTAELRAIRQFESAAIEPVESPQLSLLEEAQ